MLDKLFSIVGSSMFKEVKEVAMSYFPPSMSDEQKAIAELRMVELLHKKELETMEVLNAAASQLDKRIAEQEGTAKDLKGIPLIGSVVLFLRGLQRPLWGFATMYMDYQWFFAGASYSEQQEGAMTMINLLVLGFLFGERTMKNLEPMITKVFSRQ